MLYDCVNGQEWLLLLNFFDVQGWFFVYDLLFSEYVVFGFEYGYFVEVFEVFVFWEVQFGDFVNGVQLVIDEYIFVVEQKWGQQFSVIFFFFYGYEGQGLDYLLVCIECFLQLCVQDNMIVVWLFMLVLYFYLLCCQVYVCLCKLFIVFILKVMLCLCGVMSFVEVFIQGCFELVIDDDCGFDCFVVWCVFVYFGKVYWDLCVEFEKNLNLVVVFVCFEQMYLMLIDEFKVIMDLYLNVELVWVQEELENQGVWLFLVLVFVDVLGDWLFCLVLCFVLVLLVIGFLKVYVVEQVVLICVVVMVD